MAFIFLPSQLSLRAEFYHQFGAMITAGLPLRKALETLYENPVSRSFRRPLRRIHAQLEKGFTFAESITHSGGWLADFDIALLRAGEESGRLDQCFQLLSEHYQRRAQVARTIGGLLIYPFFLLNFAVLIIPFAAAFLNGRWGNYLQNVAGKLLPVYALLAIVVFACQGQRGERWRHLIEAFGSWIPVLGPARRNLALGRLAICLEGLLNAGMPIHRAWAEATAASGSTRLKRIGAAWQTRLESGVQSPAELMRQSPLFPELFRNLYTTGESTGSLDDTLRRLYRYYEEAGVRSLMSFARWLPRLLYLVLVFYLAAYVVRFWVGYYNGIFDAVDAL